jgi:hypothetical protein
MLEEHLGNSNEMDLFEALVSTDVGLDQLTHLLEDKGGLVPFMFAACALRAAVASIRSFLFLALTMFKATFDATLWTRLWTML